ncbi:MAG: hypothetical protein HFE84_06005 [Lachnospiraceae bacterium]|nr:hypothetical protein [Lachnospiraceae bacterium]
MPIRANGIISNFKVKAAMERYPVLADTRIETGDLLKFIELDGTTYVTNSLLNDDYAEGIARFAGMEGSLIPVYVLVYRARYRDLVFPYAALEQFTYDELRTVMIKHELSAKCPVVSQQSCPQIKI